MSLLSKFAVDLAILTVVFTVFVVGTVLWLPRIWLHDFPADIQNMVPPKTPEEKRLTTWLGIIFFTIFFGTLILLSISLRDILGPDVGFGTLWVYGYALFVGINLWDLLIIDWLGIYLTDPHKPLIPGTEGAAGYRDYRFHFIAFLKGLGIGLVFATIYAGSILLCWNIVALFSIVNPLRLG